MGRRVLEAEGDGGTTEWIDDIADVGDMFGDVTAKGTMLTQLCIACLRYCPSIRQARSSSRCDSLVDMRIKRQFEDTQTVLRNSMSSVEFCFETQAGIAHKDPSNLCLAQSFNLSNLSSRLSGAL